MKKSYQSEISAWLFHPNISKTSVHAIESIVQISVDFFVSGTHYKHAIDQHLFLFNQQKLLTGDLNRRILCSPGTCVISFAFISNITVYIYSMYISPYVCIGNFRRSIFYEYTSIFILIL